ncbi:MAG: phytoene desaturase family protein [Thermomicrobium sp.]|nr:phytoene desaturase family protein [Thermomicrobium sp.]
MRHVIVVGAGFGGLATAIRLAAHGYRVTVFEALDRPGGRAGALTLGPYRFDTGPTLLTLPSLLDALCRLAGTRLQDELELVRLSPYYRILFGDGRAFEYWGDPERDEEEIARFDPRAVPAYRSFMRATQRIYKRAFGELAAQPFDRLGTFLGVLPELLRLEAHRSVYRFVSRYFHDPYLRMVFSFHPLFIGGNPLRASAIYSIVPYLERLEGVYFARGGMQAVVGLLVRLLERLGSSVRFGTPVRELVVSDRRVTGVVLDDGERVVGDAVIVNGDVATTVTELLPASARPRWLVHWIARARYSMSCYILYGGFSRRFEQLRHHTIVMPSDYESHIRELFDGDGTLSELAFYLHAPTRTDPDFAPPGHESLYVLVPVPHLGRGGDWSPGARDRFRERVLHTLEYLHGLDGLTGALETWSEWTPLDFRDRLRSYHGAAFSFEPTLLQSAYFRPHNRSGIPGLYFVGAGTHPGAGIPGVLLSAAVTAQAVLEDVPLAHARTMHVPHTAASERRLP